MSLSQRLQQLREHKSISVKQLSDIGKVTERTIRSYESGDRKPSFDFLFNLYKNLKLNLNWLVSGEGNMFVSEQECLSYENLLKQEYNFDIKDIKFINTVISFVDSKNK